MSKIVCVYQVDAIDKFEWGIDGWESHEYFIGVFSSVEKWKEIEPQYKQLPGFNKNTCEFRITEYKLEVDDGCKLESVYRLTHEYETEEYYYDTDFGLFVFESQAVKEMENILKDTEKENECFRNHPDGFVIDECMLDEADWREGFDCM